MKQNYFHSFLQGHKAGSFSVNIAPVIKDQIRQQEIYLLVLPRKVTGTLISPHIPEGAGMIAAAPPSLQAGVGAELAGVMVS